MSKIHCESCGYIVQPIDRFCLKCGASLKSSKTLTAERTHSTNPEQKKSSQSTPHRQEARATGDSRTPKKTADLSKPRKRSPNVPWLTKAEVIGLLLIAMMIVVIANRKGINYNEAIANSPTATTISITYPTAEYTGQRTVVEGEESKIEIGSVGTLPNELPRDVPVYYPGFPTGWRITYSGIVPSLTIDIEAGSDQSSVLDWYRSNLSSNGWMIGPLDVDLGTLQCSQGKTEVIAAKKDNRILQVSVCGATSCQTNCTTNIVLFYTENN